MKPNDKPIPLRSVVCLPKPLLALGVGLSLACMLFGVGLVVFGLTHARGGWRGELGGYVGGAFGCLIGGAGGLFGTLRDWKRRLPADAVFAHLELELPTPFYRRVFWPALAGLAVGLVLGFTVGGRAAWQGVVQTSSILVFLSGSIEWINRHTRARARAVFTLYADGVLDPESTAAIDDARRKNPGFDAKVRRFQALGEQVRRAVL